ncbi:MAG: SIR2 family NAD-dependent protein deacylase [Desulfobacteraceae bacterium]
MAINELKEALQKAERVTVLTGAGVSAESGIPTFRGADGLWKNYQAIEACRSCQVMLVIGTSSVVQPAASLAFTAKSGGARVAEINLERTPSSDRMDVILLGKAGEMVPRLAAGWEDSLDQGAG